MTTRKWSISKMYMYVNFTFKNFHCILHTSIYMVLLMDYQIKNNFGIRSMQQKNQIWILIFKFKYIGTNVIMAQS